MVSPIARKLAAINYGSIKQKKVKHLPLFKNPPNLPPEAPEHPSIRAA